MTRVVDVLRSVGVFNPHGFYAVPGEATVSIVYLPSEVRSPFPSRWQVMRFNGRVYVVTAERGDAHWSDYGRKSFAARGGAGGKAEALAEAQAWAAARYGVAEWKRDPFGSYGPAEFVTRRVADLKRAAAEAAR